jgi:CRISPR associated protein Cas1
MNGSGQSNRLMPLYLASKKIHPKTFPNCAVWKPTAPPPIFVAGLACRLNGAAPAAGQFPDNWHSIGVRSSPYHLAGNRNAAHPVNAILNYAYAALESEIRIKAISDGYDPTTGIMHEGSDGSSKFILI